MSGVALDFHTPAAAEALLPAPEFAIEKSLVHFKACGQARKESDQSFAVRFSGREVAQHKCSILPDAGFLWSFRIGKRNSVSPANRRKRTPW